MYPTQTCLVFVFSVKFCEPVHARISGGDRKYEFLIQSQQLADRGRDWQQSSCTSSHFWFGEHVYVTSMYELHARHTLNSCTNVKSTTPRKSRT
jgi:hypothetical protein